MLTSLHEKIKNDFNHLVPPVDEVEEIVVPKDLFYLPNLLSLDAEILCFFFDDLVDIQTLERLEHFHHLNWWAVKEPKNRLYPIVTRGDGNCLLHAASLGIYGVHDKELTLRGSVHRLLPQLPSKSHELYYNANIITLSWVVHHPIICNLDFAGMTETDVYF